MLKRLDIQIPLILSLILAATIAMFGWRVGTRQGALYVDVVTENVMAMAQVHANSAAHFLVIKEYAGLEEHMLEAAQLPDILGLQVMEPDGRLLCDVSRPERGAPAALSYKLKTGALPSGAGTQLAREDGRLVCWMPIEAGTRLGWLKLTYSLQPVAEFWSSVWRSSLLVGIFWGVLGIGIMVLALRRPLSAIRSLATFAHDLNRNKGGQVAIPFMANEIGQLANALNTASLDLQLSEQQLLAEQERLAVTIRSIGEGVLACDRNGLVMLMNRSAEEMTGWEWQDALGKPFAEVFQVVDEGSGEMATPPLSRVIEAGRAIELVEHAVLVARDGTRRHVADSGAPILNAAGEVLGVVIVFRDETAHQQAELARGALEEQLRQSQKMESLGLLAGGIAHDFNNILTAIIGFTSIIIDRSPEADMIRELAQRVLKAANRATDLTRGLLAFSRKQAMELRLCDLNAILRDMEKMLRRIIGEDIELKAEFTALPLMAKVDAGQIEQVLLNLATNARDAMPAGGLLSITTQVVSAEELSLLAVQDSSRAARRYGLICVSDSGAGIDAATMAKIFEPFFTTKVLGKGTGLGLAIVHGIVQQHGGCIRVYSNPGIGTTFKVYLPLMDEAVLDLPTEEVQQVVGGSERILLVEDEVEVRQVVSLMLTAAGYEVVEAEHGVDALAQMQPDESKFDLIISDIIMPEMSGKELHELVMQRWPQQKMLFISGYTTDVIQYKGILTDEVDLVMKPFGADTLLLKVRELLDRAEDGTGP